MPHPGHNPRRGRMSPPWRTPKENASNSTAESARTARQHPDLESFQMTPPVIDHRAFGYQLPKPKNERWNKRDDPTTVGFVANHRRMLNKLLEVTEWEYIKALAQNVTDPELSSLQDNMLRQSEKLWYMDVFETIVLDAKPETMLPERHVQMSEEQVARNNYLRDKQGAPPPENWRERLQEAGAASECQAAKDAAETQEVVDSAESASESRVPAGGEPSSDEEATFERRGGSATRSNADDDSLPAEGQIITQSSTAESAHDPKVWSLLLGPVDPPPTPVRNSTAGPAPNFIAAERPAVVPRVAVPKRMLKRAERPAADPSDDWPLKRARGATSRSDEQQQQCRRPVDLKPRRRSSSKRPEQWGRPFNLWGRANKQQVKIRAPPVPAVVPTKKPTTRNRANSDPVEGHRPVRVRWASPSRDGRPPHTTPAVSAPHRPRPSTYRLFKWNWGDERGLGWHRHQMCKK